MRLIPYLEYKFCKLYDALYDGDIVEEERPPKKKQDNISLFLWPTLIFSKKIKRE